MNKLPSLARSWPVRLLWLAILAYALGFSYLTLVRYFAFEARALDMGNLDQAIWNTAHGRPFHFTNQPGALNRLSLHVEPILIPISWLYWLYSGPPTLLILQATVVALGAWPLFLLARQRLQNEWLALIFGLLLLLNPTLQAANWLEFHPVTLAPTFLIAAFYCLVTGRQGWFVIFAVLAAACKEEIALLVFMLGFYALVVLRRRWLGLLTMLLSLGWALTAVLVIQNLFAAGNIHWGRYAYLGETPLQIVTTLLTQPALVWTQLVRANGLGYLALLLLPVGFVALAAPEILLLALPSFAINLLADFPPMHRVTELIYAAPIAPFVLLAAVYGVARLAGYGSRPVRTLFAQPQRLAALFTCLALGGALFAQVRFGYLPGGGNFRHYTITDHHRRAAALIEQIPPHAAVSAQDRLNPHVSSRETVYIFPRIDNADTVFLDVTGPAWPLHPNDVRRQVDELLAADFGIAAADDGYLLLRKGVDAQTPPAAFYTAWLPEELPDRRPAFVFGDELRLLDVQVLTDSHGEVVTQLFWTALKPIGRELRFYVGYLDATGTLLQDTQFYPPVVELWYPTAQWPVAQPVLVQTLPWTLATNQFTLVVAVHEAGADRQLGQRLPVTAEGETLVVLEGGTLARLGGYVQTGRDGWSEQTLPPPPSGPTTADFGDQIRLEGWQATDTQVAPGETVELTLAWRTLAQPALDYSLFLHLLDEAGAGVAQLDWQPHDSLGPRPMTTWRPGQTLVEEVSLALPTTLAGGRYQLILGVYDWQTGERLTVTGANARPDQTMALQPINVEDHP